MLKLVKDQHHSPLAPRVALPLPAWIAAADGKRHRQITKSNLKKIPAQPARAGVAKQPILSHVHTLVEVMYLNQWSVYSIGKQSEHKIFT